MKKGKEKTILIVESESSIAKTLHEIIAWWGYDCYWTADTVVGLNLVLALDCDLVIVDYYKPVMSGAEFIEKALSIAPYTKFLLHSGVADYYKEKCFEKGAAAAMNKIINLNELAAVLDFLIGKPPKPNDAYEFPKVDISAFLNPKNKKNLEEKYEK